MAETPRSTEAYKAYHTAQEKYDYFMLGVSTAVLAFILQQYKPHKPGAFIDYFDQLALILLLASVYYGIRRLEGIVETIRHNYVVLDAGEKLATVVKSVKIGGDLSQAGMQLDTEVFTAQQTARRQESERLRDLFRSSSTVYYRRRDAALIIAMTLLVATRLARPYFQ